MYVRVIPARRLRFLYDFFYEAAGSADVQMCLRARLVDHAPDVKARPFGGVVVIHTNTGRQVLCTHSIAERRSLSISRRVVHFERGSTTEKALCHGENWRYANTTGHEYRMRGFVGQREVIFWLANLEDISLIKAMYRLRPAPRIGNEQDPESIAISLFWRITEGILPNHAGTNVDIDMCPRRERWKFVARRIGKFKHTDIFGVEPLRHYFDFH